MSQNDTIKQLSAGYKAAKTYYKGLWDQRKHNFELYLGIKPKKKYRSEANFHVPYTKTLLDNVWPLLTAKLPIAKTVPRNSKRDGNASRLMQAVIDFTFEANTFDKTFIDSVKEAMFFDSAWTKVVWSPDQDKNHALIVPLNTMEVYPHPNKITLDDPWPIYIKREMTKSEMIAEGWDKRKIKALGESKLGNEAYRKQQLDIRGVGSAPESNKNKYDDLYEVFEAWGMFDLSFKGEDDAEKEMSCFVMANGDDLINPEPYGEGLKPFQSPYSNNMLPLAFLPYDPIPHMMLGGSFIDPIADMQEELNALENMKADNYKRRNNPPIQIARKGDVDLSTLKFVNAAPWLVNSMGDIAPFILPDLAPSIDNQQQMIRRTMQNVTGANDVLLTTPESMTKGSKMSATHSNIVNENTKTHFRPQALLIDLWVERVGKLLINLYQDKRFFTQKMALSIADEEGQYFEEFVKHKDIEGDLMFKTDTASSITKSDQAILQQTVQLKELYAQDQSIDPTEFDKVILEKAGFDFNKMKRGKEKMIGDAVNKLKQLMALVRQGNQDPKILAQIDQLKQVIAQAQGGQSGEQPGAQPGAQPGQPSGQPQAPGGSAPMAQMAAAGGGQ